MFCVLTRARLGAMADGLSVFVLSLFSLPAVGATTFSENVGTIAMTRVRGVFLFHSLRKDIISCVNMVFSVQVVASCNWQESS